MIWRTNWCFCNRISQLLPTRSKQSRQNITNKGRFCIISVMKQSNIISPMSCWLRKRERSKGWSNNSKICRLNYSRIINSSGRILASWRKISSLNPTKRRSTRKKCEGWRDKQPIKLTICKNRRAESEMKTIDKRLIWVGRSKCCKNRIKTYYISSNVCENKILGKFKQPTSNAWS